MTATAGTGGQLKIQWGQGQFGVKGREVCLPFFFHLDEVMYRRRNPNEMEDEIQLVRNVSPDVSSSASVSEVAPTRIKEESHVVPHKLSVFRRRVIAKASSPRGKLLYWWITVFFLGLFAFLLALVPLLVERRNRQDCSDYEGQQGDNDDLPYFYRTENGRLEICRQRSMVLEGNLGVGRNYISEVKVNVFTHSMNSTLNITSSRNNNKNCLLVQWKGLSSKDVPLRDCYEIGQSNWYGAYENFQQYWPINKSDLAKDPVFSAFLPHDYLSKQFYSEGAFGPILHPLWLSTNGVGILVDEGVQLYVSMNDTQLCLIAQPFELDCFPRALDYAFLNYTVCVFDTIAQTAQYFLNSSGLIPRPRSTPSPAVFQNPIWSTWAEFKTNITTENIAKFCLSIVENNFNKSQLEIDNGYSRFYGELDFNADVSISDLMNTSCRGFNITAWVHPFVNFDSPNFKSGLSSGLFLPGISQLHGNEVSLVEWWQGFGAVINFISDDAFNATSRALSKFKETHSLSSFKFDGGEYTYLPRCVNVEGLNHPGDFTKSYVKFVGSQPYSDNAEVRVGFYTQEQPVFVRLLDRTSTWSLENGLQSVLTATLSVGLGGYNFVIPDMIGGNGEITGDISTVKPSSELFIRWAQLNTFLPVMQFSISPWGYDTATTEHVLALTQLHYSLGFHRFAEETLETGFPIIRPLWWNAIESNDNKTWTISDQFFIGDDYMVAPVLNSCTQREVYFPLGFNYSVVNSSLSALSVCKNNVCQEGSQHTFNVTLYQVLFFHVL